MINIDHNSSKIIKYYTIWWFRENWMGHI